METKQKCLETSMNLPSSNKKIKPTNLATMRVCGLFICCVSSEAVPHLPV